MTAARLVAYDGRQQRIQYLVQRYHRYLQGRILDVGCDEAHLRAYYPGRYCGIDRGPAADIALDLECGTLPFQDQGFDCVVCTDTLEHIDRLHPLFREMIRVSRRYLILSLPNCWSAAWPQILRGRGEIEKYGLPIDPPEDRHRWFFNYAQAEEFIRGQAAKERLTVRVCEPYWGSDRFLKKLLHIPYLWHPIRRRNLFARALWTVLER